MVDMKYEYSETEECFKRADNRGRPLFVNIMEARQIESFIDLGYSVEEIKDKVKLSNNKAGRHTIISFIKNLKEGNIDLEGDYEIPIPQIVEIDDDMRISALEKRVSILEDVVSEIKPEDESHLVKFKRKLGL